MTLTLDGRKREREREGKVTHESFFLFMCVPRNGVEEGVRCLRIGRYRQVLVGRLAS